MTEFDCKILFWVFVVNEIFIHVLPSKGVPEIIFHTLSIDDYARDGGPGEVSLLCSFTMILCVF